MAYVAKLFFERAEYKPTRLPIEKKRGFAFADVAAGILRDRANAAIKERLSDWVTLEKPLEIKSLDVSILR